MSDYNTYINTIDVIEDSVIDDTKFPIVKDTKIKQICRVFLGVSEGNNKLSKILYRCPQRKAVKPKYPKNQSLKTLNYQMMNPLQSNWMKTKTDI